MLVIGVIVETQSCRETVQLIKFRFKHQRSIRIRLVYIVEFSSVHRILIVPAGRKNQCQIRILLLIEYISILSKKLITLGIDSYLIEIIGLHTCMMCLSAVPAFGQCLETCLKNIVISHICPSVPDIILLYPGNIYEAVIIAVVCFGLVLIMCQQRGAPAFGQLQGGICIRLIPTGTACEKIGGYPVGFRQLRLFKLDIDLSCDSFVAILHRRDSFGNLYALHPRTGNISQSIRGSRATIVRDILCQHLHISSGQSEQFNLFGSRCSIRITHVHRRVGHKAFSKIATGSSTQFGTAYHLFIHHTAPQLHRSHSAADHIHFIQLYTIPKDDIQLLILLADMNRIILKTDKTDHQHVTFRRFGDRKTTIFFRCYSLTRIHPEYISTRNGFSGIIFDRPPYLRIGCNRK